MRSAAVDKAPKNMRSQRTAPHNSSLRIIGPAHKDSVARSFVVGGVGFRDDADAFGLQAEGDDLALEIVADLLERTDGSHITSPVLCFEPATTAASMAIYRPRTIGDAPEGPQRSGGRSRSDFLVSRGMGEAQGKKVDATALRLRRSRRSRSSARSSHHRGPVRRVLNHKSGRR